MPSGRAREREQTAVTLEGVHAQSGSCRRAREREETAPRCPDLAGGHERENRPLSRSKVSRSCRRARSKVSRSCRRARAFARSHSYSYSACRFFAARSVSNRSSHAEWGRVGGRGRENRPLSRSKVSRSCFVFRNTHHRFIFARPGSRALFAGPVIFAGSRFAPAAPRCDDGVVRGQNEVTWQN